MTSREHLSSLENVAEIALFTGRQFYRVGMGQTLRSTLYIIHINRTLSSCFSEVLRNTNTPGLGLGLGKVAGPQGVDQGRVPDVCRLLQCLTPLCLSSAWVF